MSGTPDEMCYNRPSELDIEEEVIRMERQCAPAEDGNHLWATEEEKREQWERETFPGDPRSELKRKDGK